MSAIVAADRTTVLAGGALIAASGAAVVVAQKVLPLGEASARLLGAGPLAAAVVVAA